MRILYINSHHFDYLQDVVYSGLVKLLGMDNVKAFPFNRWYVFNRRYPKNLGFQPGQLVPALKPHLGSFRYDAVIVASAKPSTFQKWLSVAPHVPPSCPVLFLDGGDSPEVAGDLARKGAGNLYNEAIQIRSFDYVFKREVLKESSYPENVIPCPFAFNMDRVKNLEPQSFRYDVSFWAVESHPVRTRALTLLQDKFDCRANGTVLNQSFDKYKRKGRAYLEELRRCRIVLNFRGGGWDTLRFWEVPALGTLLISQEPDIRIPHPFIDGEHMVYCKDDLTDLIEKIDYYLAHETQRARIAQQGHQHLMNYHTDVERARMILSYLE